MQLVWPSRPHLESYVAALERGWSPDNVRGETAAREELRSIAADSAAFLAGLVDREAKGSPITLPDGSTVPRLPGYRRWMWDGEFCGSIGFGWQPGTRRSPHIAWGTSDTRSFLGSGGEGMQHSRSACCCQRLARKGCRSSSSRPIQRT